MQVTGKVHTRTAGSSPCRTPRPRLSVQYLQLLLWSSSQVLLLSLETAEADPWSENEHGHDRTEHYNSFVASTAPVVVPFVPVKTVVHVVDSLVLWDNAMQHWEGCSRSCMHQECGISASGSVDRRTIRIGSNASKCRCLWQRR